MRTKPSTVVGWSIVAVVLLCGFWMLVQRIQQYADATPHPVERKLTELEGAASIASFTAPSEAELFNFVIGVSKTHALPTLRGTLIVHSEGKELHRRTFTEKELKPCNWLDKHGLQGYIVDWIESPSPAQTLVQLQPGVIYAVEMKFDHPLSIPASLWLTFNQSWKAYKNASATN